MARILFLTTAHQYDDDRVFHQIMHKVRMDYRKNYNWNVIRKFFVRFIE